MADPKKDIKDIEKELNALKAKLDQTTSDSLSKLIKNLKAGGASLSEWNTLLDAFSTKADSLADDLDYVSKSLTDSVNELIRGNEYINQQIKSTRKLGSIANDLLSMRKGESTYDLKKIKSLEEQAKKQRQILRSQLDQFVGSQKDLDALKDKIGVADDLLISFTQITEEARKFQKSMGITGGILKGMSKIPILGNMLGTQEALEAAEEAAKNGAGRLGTMSAAAKSMGKSLLSSVSDPVVVMGTLLSIFKELDDSAEKYARTMNITYKEALQVRNEMDAVAGITKGQMLEASMAINKELGTSAQLTQENAAAFAKLQVYAGMTEEDLMGITSLSLANGKNIKQNTNEFIAQAKQIAAGKKIVLNEKQLLADISKISAATTLSLGKNPKELAKAVATAKSLGMEMGKLEDIAGGLLDFESSIENELSAELLTGKDLNLEKARQLALNNDIAGMAEEINKQIGTSADYTKMNRIQQEALAKAVGMNREELAQTLYTQEQIQGLTGKAAEDRQALLDQRIEEVGLAQAQREIEQGGFEELEKQAGIQTQFNQSMLELKDILTTAILPAFITIGTFVKDHLGLIKSIVGIYLTLKAAQMGFIAAQKISLLFSKQQRAISISEAGAAIVKGNWSSVGITPFVGAALAIAGIAAGVATLYSLTSMKDGMIDPKGGMIVSGEKGSIQLDKEDSIIAGTNLIGNKNKSTNQPQESKSTGNTQVNVDMTQTNALLQQLIGVIQSGGDVVLDGQKVGQALNLISYKTQ
jgi:hypothetical protein